MYFNSENVSATQHGIPRTRPLGASRNSPPTLIDATPALMLAYLLDVSKKIIGDCCETSNPGSSALDTQSEFSIQPNRLEGCS